MTFVVPESGAMRRHLLIIGVAEYQPGWPVIRDGVEAEVAKAQSLFLDLLKFETSTFARVSDTTRNGILHQISDWRKKVPATPGDLLVVYYTGHGVVDRSIFRLITSEVLDDEFCTAMPATDLISVIWTGDRHILLIVDTCQSSAGAGDAMQLIPRLRDAEGGAARGFGLYIIATARSIESARTKAFIDGLEQVIRSGSAGDPDVEFLRPDDVIEKVNTILGVERDGDNQQHVNLSGSDERLFRFFPNPWWEPRLRIGMSPEGARRVFTRIQRSALLSHWGPRARGVALDSESSWLFTGRTLAARRLVTLFRSAAGNAGLIVTGPPGAGKSALLARMVTLADPSLRELAQRAGALDGVPQEELPPIDSLSAAVYARSKTVGDIALELAVALDADLRSGESDPEALARGAAVARKIPATILVDALDEARNSEQVAAFLRSIADRAKQLCIVVGIRGEEGTPNRLVDRLGGRFTVLDLGTAEYLDKEDIRRYVERSLLASSSSPYRKPGQEKYAAQVAGAVAARAGRSFLVASRTAASLATRAEVIPEADLGELPTAAGEAFEFDLKLLSDSERDEAIAVFGALAFAQGRGLPHALWAPFATALGPGPFSDRDIDRWLERSGSYVTREEDLGTLVMRLYHEEFARFLRRKVKTRAAEADGVCADPEGILVETLEATVPIDPASGERDWVAASPYVRSYLLRHLRAAGRCASLYSLVLDQRWVSARIERGDPAPLLEDLDLAIQAARDEAPSNVEIVARCCLAYGRWMTTAPPLVVDVLAAVGQLSRAAFIADNISYPLDRCQAFCLLAQRNVLCYPEQARKQFLEARRSARNVLGSYWAMTSYWLAHAARALADPSTAYEVALDALRQTQLKVQRWLGERPDTADWWEEEQELDPCYSSSAKDAVKLAVDTFGRLDPRPSNAIISVRLGEKEFMPGAWMELTHALFWTSMALREAGEETGLERIRYLLATAELRGFNLQLQAAAVAGDTAYLESFLPWHSDKLPEGPGGILRGNLALALATAGRCDDAIRFLEETRSHWEHPGPYMADSAKRLAWALALCGRFEEAFVYIGSMPHPEERLRALYRVTEVLLSKGRKAELDTAADLAERLLAEDEKELKRVQSLSIPPPTLRRGGSRKKSATMPQPGSSERWLEFTAADFWRLRSWTSWILAAAGRMERALELAEAVCGEEINPSEETSLARPTRVTEMAKLHVHTEVRPSADKQLMVKALAEADANHVDEALRIANLIASTRHKFGTWADIAVKLLDEEQALDLWLSVVIDARRVGQGLVIEILGRGKQLLGAAARSRLEELMRQAEEAEFR